MRLLVMFDIPVGTGKERKAYSKFRRFLLNNGYEMLQYSIYVRFCRNDSDAKKHNLRLEKNAPLYGDVRVMKLTNNQYEGMIILIGEPSEQSKVVGRDPLVIIK